MAPRIMSTSTPAGTRMSTLPRSVRPLGLMRQGSSLAVAIPAGPSPVGRRATRGIKAIAGAVEEMIHGDRGGRPAAAGDGVADRGAGRAGHGAPSGRRQARGAPGAAGRARHDGGARGAI